VIEVPGERPMSPPITVSPVLVIALPANTAKLDAVPRSTVAVAAMADWAPKAASVMSATPVTKRLLQVSRSVRGTGVRRQTRRVGLDVADEG